MEASARDPGNGDDEERDERGPEDDSKNPTVDPVEPLTRDEDLDGADPITPPVPPE